MPLVFFMLSDQEVIELVHDPDEIRRQIEELEQKIQELLFLPVINSDGEIISYADLEV